MNYSIISKYRTQIMGIAVLWIAILHATMWFPIEPINWLFKSLGQNGVDIFLFLSSFGLYYSWQKNPDTKIFLKKRFLRIIPVFIPIALFRCYYLKYSLYQSILTITALEFWINTGRSVWYISAILVLYLITPFYLKRFDNNEKKLTIISMIISFIIGAIFFKTGYTVFFCRLPIFFLGFYVGYLAYNQRAVSKVSLIVYVLMFIGGFGIYRYLFVHVSEIALWDYGLYWYPMIIIIIPFCLFLSYFFNKCHEYKIPLINDLFYKIGSVSLEFYLFHELIIKIVPHIITVNPYYGAYGIILNIMIIFMTYYLAKYYQDGLNYMLGLIKNYD